MSEDSCCDLPILESGGLIKPVIGDIATWTAGSSSSLPLSVEVDADSSRCRTLLQTALDLRRQQRLSESEKAFRLALALQPANMEALLGLATVLYRSNQMEEANQWVACVLRGGEANEASRIEEKLTDRLLLATVDLVEQLRLHEKEQQADALIEKIIGLDADNEAMHQQFGMLLLRCGEFRYGWQERDKRVGPFPQPVWRGVPLTGKKFWCKPCMDLATRFSSCVCFLYSESEAGL